MADIRKKVIHYPNNIVIFNIETWLLEPMLNNSYMIKLESMKSMNIGQNRLSLHLKGITC